MLKNLFKKFSKSYDEKSIPNHTQLSEAECIDLLILLFDKTDKKSKRKFVNTGLNALYNDFWLYKG